MAKETQRVMLKKGGVRIMLTNSSDIQRHISLGYKIISKHSPPKEKTKPKLEPKIEENKDEGPKLSSGVLLAVEALEISDPSELSAISDKELLAVKGIGAGALKGIRESFPLVSSEEGE